MSAGLSWPAWLLISASVCLGLLVELIFYFTHRTRYRSHGSDGP